MHRAAAAATAQLPIMIATPANGCSIRKNSKKRSRSKSLVRARKKRIRGSSRGIRNLSTEDQFRNAGSQWGRPHRTPTLFERYIHLQNLVPSWEVDELLATLRRPLPIAFRVRTAAAAREWEAVRRTLAAAIASSAVRVRPVPGIPGGHQIHIRSIGGSCGDLLRTDPELRPLRSFLSSQTAAGGILRQEVASMIPVAMLGVRSDHAVLDLCASPGSKTCQAVDRLFDDASASGGGGISPSQPRFLSESQSKSQWQSQRQTQTRPPTGFVLANDADVRRSYVLANRIKRLGDRSRAVAVTCHNAARFPNVDAPLRRRRRRDQNHHHVQGQGQDRDDDQHPYMTPGPYDRIICDVPCSGDGTIRKDRKVARVWHPSYGLGLHTLQLRIALRAAALLRVGGLVAYSTCTFNPIENEAVVAELLRRSRGCLEVVDPGEVEFLHVGDGGDVGGGLKFRRGLETWRVVDDDLVEHHSPSPSTSSASGRMISADQRRGAGVVPDSVFPPDESAIVASLGRCVRLFPHDNDTGGFFIALLRKTSEWSRPPWLRSVKNPSWGGDCEVGHGNDEDGDGVDDADESGLRKGMATETNAAPWSAVTPVTDCHRFRPVAGEVVASASASASASRGTWNDDDGDDPAASASETGDGPTLRYYSRSPASPARRERCFGLLPALADHAFDSVGSDRLNMVYAGHRGG